VSDTTLRLLDIQASTRFELTNAGRLVCENSPDRSPAPRLWLSGSAEGNAIRFRADVSDKIVEEISELAAREPALSDRAFRAARRRAESPAWIDLLVVVLRKLCVIAALSSGSQHPC